MRGRFLGRFRRFFGVRVRIWVRVRVGVRVRAEFEVGFGFGWVGCCVWVDLPVDFHLREA